LDELTLIPDDELERLAGARGPGSVEANSLAELRQLRAQDQQVFAYRLGKFIVMPWRTPLGGTRGNRSG
jgi:hypothetical protein